MNLPPRRAGGVTLPVVLVTLAFIGLGFFATGFLAGYEPFLVLGMMLLLGLPHGATDHGLFLALRQGGQGEGKGRFYLAYLGIIAAYGLVWYLLPLVAFGIFILLSVYHFGQSNWVDTEQRPTFTARAHYLLWGMGVLLTPILLHAEEAAAIVATMTDTVIATPALDSVYWIIAVLGLANVVTITTLKMRGVLDTRRTVLELLAYALLTLLFFTNSLLLGFTIYFVFWHSLSSIQDQMQFFERRMSRDLRQKLSVGIGTTVVGALAFCLIVWFGPGPEAALRPAIIGGVFVFISLLTMPHMLLVEQLYTSWSPNDNPPDLPRKEDGAERISFTQSPSATPTYV
ncbi:Brp/Blh family beta-carotene 15,15'-dioxygenase [Neolewinella antarctica]|uniref:Probable beta-carotene 15,15'-dioxygenase n=1 Tax=Neolewinella antarctica TaxID=442734 RepID=A0ABX0XC01_9BACT|nr:Brp/Blh family beta-carotene 15,15'-dioxygenase [Neolewinella antarctica]NJC26783.1 Brp/Blh family beta-carotene 15,15'-monooxygenase [Neolewinella antarctica]